MPAQAALDRAVLRERLRLLWRHTPVSVGATWVIALAITAAVHASGGGGGALLGWALGLLSLGLARLVHYRRLSARVQTIAEPRRHLLVLASFAWGTAVLWAMVPLVFLRIEIPLLVCVVAFSMLGASSGAIGSQGAYMPAYVGFITITLCGVATKFILVGGVLGWAVVTMAAAYTAACISTAKQANLAWVEALRAGMINEALAARLVREHAQAVTARQEAEAAVLAKTRFLAAASHDLRQPLHAQALFLGALTRAEKGPEAARLAARIADTGRALQELLDGLLDVSKLDAGAVVASPRPFPVQSLLEQVRDQFAALAHAKGIELRIVPCSAWVRSDPVIVGRIARNLVSNAIRYTERGRVLVGVKRGALLRLCVFDSGVGIPTEAQESIFEEFVQLYNPERDRSRGIGLGLAIVRRLASLLGAELSLRSEVGRGSVFAIALPRVPPPSRVLIDEVTGSDASEAPLEGRRILVVDDELLVLEALQTYLESLGCVVHAAGDGDEAVRLAAAGTPLDVVIVDHRLRGEETGLAVIERLRAALGRPLPAILTTGDTAPERIREAMTSGYPLLHKPVATRLLVVTLAGAIGQDQAAEPEAARGVTR